MASKEFAVIDIQNDDDEINLQFQDFGNSSVEAGDSSKTEQTVYFSNFPDSATEDQEEQLIEDENSQSKVSYSFWTFEYYQQFFDVDSKQVGDRIIWSMIPKPGINYLQSYIRPKPDLYGPFWICLTLVFTTAIIGNLANYIQQNDSQHWRYDFHKVTLAASAIFFYAWLVPVAIWGILLWRGSRANVRLLELICLYGYSLSVFIPVSILWAIPFPWLQWCLGIVATVLSGSVLVKTILPAISHEAQKIAVAVAIFVLLLHAVLAFSFMLYFFHVPASNSSVNATSTVTQQILSLTDKPEHNLQNNKSSPLDKNHSESDIAKRDYMQSHELENIKSISSPTRNIKVKIKNESIYSANKTSVNPMNSGLKADKKNSEVKSDQSKLLPSSTTTHSNSINESETLKTLTGDASKDKSHAS